VWLGALGKSGQEEALPGCGQSGLGIQSQGQLSSGDLKSGSF
jgi:hypothetical protein